MRVEAFSRFVQISIEEYNPMLDKLLKYATKHFQKQYHLSSSILILDDGERFKKDYMITWAYHSSMQGQSSEEQGNDMLSLDSILEQSHLPIRIKITSSNALLECIRISFRMLGLNRAVLILDKPNHIAKRYLGALLSDVMINSDLNHIYLDTAHSNFWASIMSIIGNKVIHNVRLEFDYDSFKTNKNSKRGFSYFTKQEQRVHNAYAVLGCSNLDSFFDIRNKFLELVKQYHPDNVFGKDEEIVQAYNAKFIELKEAFDIIKDNFEIAS